MESFSAEEFLQGFLEEASEHLGNIKNILLRLEESDSLEQEDLLQELFRSFHTLKGLSGMVGLNEAIQLSHAMENLLQAAQKKQVAVDQRFVDTLIDQVQVLTQVVDTLRANTQVKPDIQPALQRIQSLLQPLNEGASPGDSTAKSTNEIAKMLPGLVPYPQLLNNLNAVDQRKVLAAVRNGQVCSLVKFVPSKERSAQGINVDLLRQQLGLLGSVLKAVPVMEAGGNFYFLFLVATPQVIEADGTIADEVTPLLVETPAEVPEAEIRPSVPGERVANRNRSQGSTVRVNLRRLDDLMLSTGNLYTLRNQLRSAMQKMEDPGSPFGRELRDIEQRLGRALRDLRGSILAARMVPLGETFNQMPLVVRDLARSTEKEIILLIEGESTEIDKLIVDRLMEPLIHLVRNAITHGIEPPDVREEAGKPRQGTLTLRGAALGDRILIEVTDDGRGIDLINIAKRAEERGWIASSEKIDVEQALEFILRPGFTTQNNADLSSGRGIGLDVVARMVRAFSGQLTVETTAGIGTTFRLLLPLTLVILTLLLVEAGGELYAIPQQAVERILEVDPSQVTKTESGELALIGEQYYAAHRLENLLHSPGKRDSARCMFGLVSVPETRTQNSKGLPLLLVDRAIELREMVVQPINDPLVSRPGVSGAAELGDGRVVLILDLPVLLRSARRGA